MMSSFEILLVARMAGKEDLKPRHYREDTASCLFWHTNPRESLAISDYSSSLCIFGSLAANDFQAEASPYRATNSVILPRRRPVNSHRATWPNDAHLTDVEVAVRTSGTRTHRPCPDSRRRPHFRERRGVLRAFAVRIPETNGQRSHVFYPLQSIT